MKVLIAAGGGGHFVPALAVIEAMPKDWEVQIVGREHAFEGDSSLSFEYQTAKKLGIPFVAITAGRLQRKISPHTFTSLLKVPVGLAQATKILKDFQPDVVITFGGYLTVPIAVAAKMLTIPIVMHEQTLNAGLANKIVSKIADKICISWKYSEKFFPKEKTIMTGNPLRKEFLKHIDTTKLRSNNKIPLIYVTGGSGGAHGINMLVERTLEKLLAKNLVIHQTGDAKEFGDYERLARLKTIMPDNLKKRYEVTKFIPTDQVVSVLMNADLVISRSGIGTVSELLYLGKPCLLIPLPFGQKNEQLINAQFVQSTGLGKLYEQDTLTPDILYEKVEEMLANISQFKSHAIVTHELINRDAAQNIIDVINNAKKN
jgi:UDP-N-acetylglucosamine--N-acetylmuramyl-(pentapeptide) pyrophosphoryl-undecaprenol N-acetylglucosamine transferase